MYLKVEVLVARSCPTLCDLMGCSPPGSSGGLRVCGIFQARTLKWVAIPSSRGSSQLGWDQHLLHLLLWQADSYH